MSLKEILVEIARSQLPLREHEFEIPVEIGSTTVRVDATAYYTYSPILPETRHDPEDGGVELLQIVAHVSGHVIIEWTDEPWVDTLIQEIYRETTGA